MEPAGVQFCGVSDVVQPRRCHQHVGVVIVGHGDGQLFGSSRYTDRVPPTLRKVSQHHLGKVPDVTHQPGRNEQLTDDRQPKGAIRHATPNGR
jgi:hypothetical protein